MKRVLGASSGGGTWSGVVLGTLLCACGGPPEDGPRAELAKATAGHRQEQPVPLSSALRRPAVAFGGDVFLTVWSDTRSGILFGARTRPDGTVLDPGGFPLQPNQTPFLPVFPNVAFDGRQFLVVWMEPEEGIFAVRVDPDGTVASDRLRIIRTDEINRERPGLACTPRLCMVSFTSQGDVGETIVGRRVFSDGTVDGSLILVTRTEVRAGEPDVAWSGDEFLFAWTDSRRGLSRSDILGNTVLPDGTVLGGRDGFTISRESGAQQAPAVVWTGERFLVVWEDDRGGDWDIFGARVDPDGDVDDPGGIPISDAKGDQRAPDVDHHAFTSLVVWDDDRSGERRIEGARVEDDGDVRDSTGFRISRGDFEEELLPSVAHGEGLYLVVHAGGREDDPLEPHDVLGVRVKQKNKKVLDDSEFLLTVKP